MMTRPIVGRVDDTGHFVFDPGQKDRFRSRLLSMAGKAVVIEVSEHQDYRTIAANRYYWGVVVAAAIEATGQDAETVHAFWKDQFLPDETKQVEFYHHMTGARVRHLVRPASTAKQSTKKFRTFVENCRLWLSEWYGITTPDPDPEFWRTKVADGESGNTLKA